MRLGWVTICPIKGLLLMPYTDGGTLTRTLFTSMVRVSVTAPEAAVPEAGEAGSVNVFCCQPFAKNPMEGGLEGSTGAYTESVVFVEPPPLPAPPEEWFFLQA